jgi:hypothetical protein
MWRQAFILALMVYEKRLEINDMVELLVCCGSVLMYTVTRTITTVLEPPNISCSYRDNARALETIQMHCFKPFIMIIAMRIYIYI